MGHRWRAALIAVLLGAGAPAWAHHSFAMFDQAHEIDLEGTVQEFRYVAPHSFIVLSVNKQDGTSESWTLEGISPSALAREGWSRTSLKAGDQIKVRIAPLRSGAPGGAWVTQKIKFRDGRPIVAIKPAADEPDTQANRQ
jgi:Family of unknown function (DUF6152)